MKTRYKDLIYHTFEFPQEEFDLKDNRLQFHGIELTELVKQYGTPLKITYLPKISQQIGKCKDLFSHAMKKVGYNGEYFFSYCTKSNHFKYVLDEALKNDIHIETSSSFDMDLVRRLFAEGKISKETKIICNGFKTPDYTEKIAGLINDGFNITPILDNKREIEAYSKLVKGNCKLGIRVASEEEPNFPFYTSRMGMRYADVQHFYLEHIAPNPKFELSMIHFFVDTGIRDNAYYWNELNKFVKLYCTLKHLSPSLKSLNIGGGMPIKKSLAFEFDYQYMVDEIVTIVKAAAQEHQIPDPDIFTEFGSFTVGESGATLFSVIGQKQQNDSELWYMIDGSVINNLPDTWFLHERFILLPLNKWNHEYTKVNIGGITCDNSDYYNSETHVNQVYLPAYKDDEEEPLMLGFFHTGAYQDALSGVGGVKHCLIPSPKHILVSKNDQGEVSHWIHREAQDVESMLSILGY